MVLPPAGQVQFRRQRPDSSGIHLENPRRWRPFSGYQSETNRLSKEVRSPGDFTAKLAPQARQLRSDAMFVHDCFWQFLNRQVVADAAGLVEEPAALMHDTCAATTIRPLPQGDVELMYDLGRQDCGYYTFDLIAPAGTIVDIFAVEYIAPDGRIQFTLHNRNGLRYVTREGVNRFTSLKRRSGRYVFLTLRNQRGPVRVRHFGLIESTYPVNAIGSFACSDARLDRIWEISTRTLKLCMEDTFTDCPLVRADPLGGRRAERIAVGLPGVRGRRPGTRSIRITGQSLARYPIAGCQTPSCWDVLLPAWSFLWGISTWDCYWYTGDKQFLREMWPDVVRNLHGAEMLVNEQGLFAGPFWNMFDWTQDRSAAQGRAAQHDVHDRGHRRGAPQGGRRSRAIPADAAWLRSLRGRLVAGANRLGTRRKRRTSTAYTKTAP